MSCSLGWRRDRFFESQRSSFVRSDKSIRPRLELDMRLTKLGHSCVRLEKNGANLVIDPGVWSGTDPLAGANALLITHEHADHIDGGVVRAALERDGSLELWTVAPVAEDFASYGG